MVLLLFLASFTLLLGRRTVAAPNQYLYRVPPPAVFEDKRTNNPISGPIIATPDRGAQARWSLDDPRFTPMGSPLPSSSKKDDVDAEAINRLYQQGMVSKPVATKEEMSASEKAERAAYGNRYSRFGKLKDELEQMKRSGSNDESFAQDSSGGGLDSKPDGALIVINNDGGAGADGDDAGNDAGGGSGLSSGGIFVSQFTGRNPTVETDNGLRLEALSEESSDRAKGPAVERIATDQLMAQKAQSDPFYGGSSKEMKSKIAKYNKMLETEDRLRKAEEKRAEVDYATESLFSSGGDFQDVERDGDTVIIYKPTEKQKRFKNLKLPPIPKMKDDNWRIQVLPPNIGQKVYADTNLHLVPVMFQYEIDQNAFALTSQVHEVSKFAAILPQVSSLDMQDSGGNTLLMHCVSSANYKCVEMLLHAGANPRLENDFGVTPLHLAVYKQDHRSLLLLLDEVSGGNDVDSNDLTPLMYAVILGDAVAIDALIDRGSNVDFVNSRGMTAISIAAEYDDRLLLEKLGARSLHLYRN